MNRARQVWVRKIWQSVLVVGLLLELVLVYGAVDAMFDRSYLVPAWQQIAFVGILIWIYIAYLKQRALDISAHVVDEKIKTHSLVEQLAEGVVLLDPDDRILLLNRRAAELTGLDEIGALGTVLLDDLDEASRRLLESNLQGEVEGRFVRSGHTVLLSVKHLARQKSGDSHKLVALREVPAPARPPVEAAADGLGRAAEVLRQIVGTLGRQTVGAAGVGREELARAGLAAMGVWMVMEGRRAPAAEARQPLAIRTLLDGLVAEFQPFAAALDVRIGLGEVQAGDIVASRPILEMAVRQVLHGAVVGAAERGKTVTVKTGPLGQHLGLSVVDSGFAVDEQSLSKLFDAGYAGVESVDGSVCRRAGIGLAFARQLVEAQGGSLWAENLADHRGLRVALMLATV